MLGIESLNTNAIQCLIDQLSCRGLALFRGTCKKFLYCKTHQEWWGYFADRYCELFPEQRLFQRRVISPTTVLKSLQRDYGHAYDVTWDPRSLSVYNRGREEQRRFREELENNPDLARHRWRTRLRLCIMAIARPCPPNDLSELIAMCVLKEFTIQLETKIVELEKMLNRHYWGKLHKQKIWNLWWKRGGIQCLDDEWIINPLTGFPIKKSAALYKKLQQQGYFNTF